MAKKPEHFPSVADEALHKSVNATDGGACLTGHSSTYDDQCSCTYRWQALQPPAKARHGRYKGVRPLTPTERQGMGGKEEGYLKTLQYLTRKGKAARKRTKEHYNPVQYTTEVKLPEHEMDWAVGGPTTAAFAATRDDGLRPGIKVPIGQNYHRDLWPYWNNAHHLIPKDLLNKQISTIKDSTTRLLVRAGLLRAEYNVNKWENVILLPQDKAVACLLALPRHLTLEGGSVVQDKKPKFDHVEYNMNVQIELKDIIDSYEDDVKSMREKTKPCNLYETIKLAKTRLEKLSGLCYDKVTAFGAASPGEPLVDMPPMRER